MKAGSKFSCCDEHLKITITMLFIVEVILHITNLRLFSYCSYSACQLYCVVQR